MLGIFIQKCEHVQNFNVSDLIPCCTSETGNVVDNYLSSSVDATKGYFFDMMSTKVTTPMK